MAQDLGDRVPALKQLGGIAADQPVVGQYPGLMGSVSFSSDGTRLASAGADGIVRIWALDERELLDIADERVTRVLNTDECAQFLRHDHCTGT